MEKQSELFNRILKLEWELQHLAAFIQNDFGKMIEDGITTKDEIKQSLSDMNEKYDKFVEKIEDIRKEANVLMKSYLE